MVQVTINLWRCKPCEFDNDVLTKYCRVCGADSTVSNKQRGLTAIKRGIFFDWDWEVMTQQEDLYAQFYNKSKLFVKDMDLTQLREHRDNLSQIAFEAKAALAGADDELRERKAKSSKKEWTITPTGPDVLTSDAINAVKVRASRMSKMDKVRKQLLSAGIDEDTVNIMVANLERKATEQNLKTVTFNKPTTEMAVVVVEASKTEIEEPKVFNPASLFGKKD